ncbi:MAG: ABC transporter permease subunit [Caldilineaceae bacterium]
MAQLAASPSIPRKRVDLSGLLGYVLVTPPLLIMIFLIFLPALQAVVRTLWTSQIEGGPATFSLIRYTGFFDDPIARANLWFTAWITVATVIMLFVVCFPLALYLRFSNSRIAGAVQVLVLFPLFVPSIILAFALIRFLGPRGTLQTVLELMGIMGYKTPYLKASGIVIGLLWDNIPFTVLVLTAGLRGVENPLLESAQDVGANAWQVFWRIILPLIQRPLLIAFCLNVIGIFGAFTIPYLLGPAQPQMMGVFMLQTYSEYLDKIGAETQAVITFLFCALVGILYVRTIVKQGVR